MLAVQLAEPLELVVVDQVLGEVARHRQVAGDEPVADPRLLARRGELFRAVLADGVEHPVPRGLAVAAARCGRLAADQTDLSTSRMTVSKISSAVEARRSAQTSSAAATLKSPAKTDSRAHSARSASVHRS